MKMSFIVAFLLGALFNGAYVQYQITGELWGKPICETLKE
jgi:hypothetical protein